MRSKYTHLTNATSRTVAIFGEVLADVFPEQTVLGGAPFNVARHLQALGLQPVIISRIGLDALGDSIMDEMHKLEMDTSGMQFDPSFPTGQVQVHLQNGAHNFEILPNQAYDHISLKITHETLVSITPQLTYFGTLALRNMESRLAAEQFWQSSRCPSFLDINLRKPWYSAETLTLCLQHADYVKLNEDELSEVANLLKLPATGLNAQAKALQQQFSLKQTLVTCGASGSWLLNESQQILHAEAALATHSIVDTVGAGDAFSAVYILGLLAKWSTQTTLNRANQFAASICSLRGAVPSTLGFYDQFLIKWNKTQV